MPSVRDIDVVFARRRRYWTNGYRPVALWNLDQLVNDKGEPLKSPGKQPRGRWRAHAAEDPPAAARMRPDSRALTTGLACGEILGLDVDILHQELADQTVHLIERIAGPTPLVRVGHAPKILLVYRLSRSMHDQSTSLER
jgi:putative DNA primase/helicase